MQAHPRTPSRVVLPLALALTLAGCGDQSGAFEDAIAVGKPLALEKTLVFVDARASRAFLLDLGDPDPEPSALQLALPTAPTLQVVRNSEDGVAREALVLCAGRRGTATQAAEPAALAAVDASGELRAYVLGETPFDRLVQSDDGGYAVTYRSKDAEDRLLSNAGELAIVDLDAKPGKSSVVSKTPRSFGHTPTAVHFSPEMTVAGEQRRLLVVFSEAEVTLIDLGHLDRRETIVQLGGAEGRRVQPQQVLFSPADGTLFVRGAASDDIYVLRLEPHPNDEKGNDFRPSINQLGGGIAPSDMALFGTGDARRLLVLSPSTGEALVVDPTSSKSTAVPLGGASVSRVLLFTSPSPRDDQDSERALLYTENGSSVLFLDLADIEARRARNLEPLSLERTIARVIPLLDRKQLVLLHAGGISLLDLASRTVIPIASDAALQEAAFDADRGRLWVGPSSQRYVSTLDLDGGSTSEVLLDADITYMVPLFAAKRVAVVHGSGIGNVTLINAVSPSRETALTLRGFFIAGALDRGES